jgi:putative DNA primase/helicase
MWMSWRRAGRSMKRGSRLLTGAERSTGRGLYEGMREWPNTAKVCMDLNHLPDFKGVDLGIERRLKVIPFDRQFSEKEQDKQMAEKLRGELPGILAWAVECRKWRVQGLAPDEIDVATRRYRDDQNHLRPSWTSSTVTARRHGAHGHLAG